MTGVSRWRARGVSDRVSVALHPHCRLEPSHSRLLGLAGPRRRRRRYGILRRLPGAVGNGARRGYHVHGAAATYDRRNGIVRRRPDRLVAWQRSDGGTLQRRPRHWATTIQSIQSATIDLQGNQCTTTTHDVRISEARF